MTEQREQNVVETFNEAYKSMKTTLDANTITYAEAQSRVYQEEHLLTTARQSENDRAKCYGTLAALKGWLDEQDREAAEIEDMYNIYCQEHPEYLAREYQD